MSVFCIASATEMGTDVCFCGRLLVTELKIEFKIDFRHITHLSFELCVGLLDQCQVPKKTTTKTNILVKMVRCKDWTENK